MHCPVPGTGEDANPLLCTACCHPEAAADRGSPRARRAASACAQFAKKLEAKGERKSAEAAAAFKKLQEMQDRIRPQAERCRDKLRMLNKKQTLDLERWLLRYAQGVQALNEQSTQAFGACLRMEDRMLISQAGASRDAACPAHARASPRAHSPRWR